MTYLDFYARIEITPTCWLWRGRADKDGYGTFYMVGQSSLAHRIAYAMFHGDLLPGLTIDHLCRTRNCVKPTHLEQVTIGTNTLRGDTVPARRKAQTHCIYGHELSGWNLIEPATRPGTRHCRQCMNRRAREYNKRKRETR